MTAAEKERRAEARRIRAAKAARARLLKQEAEFAADVRKASAHIPDDIMRVLDYIAAEIPKRTNSKDVEFLRETRDLHFRPYRKFLKTKEAV